MIYSSSWSVVAGGTKYGNRQDPNFSEKFIFDYCCQSPALHSPQPILHLIC